MDMFECVVDPKKLEVEGRSLLGLGLMWLDDEMGVGHAKYTLKSVVSQLWQPKCT